MNLCRHLFVDEAGGTEFQENPAELDIYVLCSLLIDTENLEALKKVAKQIVEVHAGKGELKSSSIGNNSERRSRVLTDISNQFQFYALSIDKARIWKDSGLRFRPVFYKFLHRMLYIRLKKTFTQIEILADFYGRTEFMQSFKDYIVEKANLFEKFEFEKSTDVPLLQIADVIGGSIRRVLQGKDNADILKPIMSSCNLIEAWPPESTPNFVFQSVSTQETDENIRTIALQNARKYVEEHLTSDDIVDQVKAEGIRYLLSKYYEDPEQYVFRDEIVQHLNANFGEMVNRQFFSTEILGDARDEHVIIISTDNGMKLPYNVIDLYKWSYRAQSQILPYLKRLEKARNNILLAMNLDIVPTEQFPELNSILENRKKLFCGDL